MADSVRKHVARLRSNAPLIGWELRRIAINALIKDGSAVTQVVFSPDGTLLVSASEDHTLRLWRVADGTLLKTLHGHESEIQSCAVSFDGGMLVSGDAQKTVRLWAFFYLTILPALPTLF